MNPKSLGERKGDWQKVVEVWFKIADFINDPKNLEEAATIMGKRVGLSADDYKKLMKGTFFLDLKGNLKTWKKTETLDSVYGSSKLTDEFFTKNKMYKAAVKYEDYLDSSVVESVAKAAGKL